MNVPDQIAALASKATAELAADYEALFGQAARYRSPTWLRKRLAFKLQENALGGLTRKARARLAELQAEAVVVLSIVAHAGTRADASGARGEALRLAMVAGSATMGIPEQQAAAQLSLTAAASALEALRRLAPLEKARLVKGLFAAVTADGTIRVGEAELMRLVGAVLDCPLPPLLESVDPATLAE